ncbi:hypothetical protein SAMN04487891_10331 [Flagellimonas taeanensis]|jgi:hypothetical protein|uniref:Uncharacterized protein n=1 Tax=Flagellimonas taeanensis TaxID=1005926 RepID=A0A1M6T209_9FLAO|nr:hypothetical protein SAMN04487891_10331 [Allomuricauda taeanensis]SHK51023.1 hypothetical protein SAMN05216293_1191 [Allomuricauda taeanensis]
MYISLNIYLFKARYRVLLVNQARFCFYVASPKIKTSIIWAHICKHQKYKSNKLNIIYLLFLNYTL